MSFFGKMLASVGIGAATVDTQLESPRVRAGEEVRGRVVLKGGSVEQQLTGLSVRVMSQFYRDINDQRVRENAVVASFEVPGDATLRPGEVREVPLSFLLPDETPAAVGRTPVWLSTGLEVVAGVDPSDNDRLEVLPHRHTEVVLDAIGTVGFRLREVECEYSRLGRRVPFVQEWEFVPTGQFRGHLDELEAVFFPSAQGIDVLLQVDRKARGLMGLFAEATGTDERLVRVSFSRAELSGGPEHVAGELAAVIRRHAR
jgi:sporulation-control protein